MKLILKFKIINHCLIVSIWYNESIKLDFMYYNGGLS